MSNVSRGKVKGSRSEPTQRTPFRLEFGQWVGTLLVVAEVCYIHHECVYFSEGISIYMTVV